MTVCIAEKPSVARDIAKVLGANNTKNGYIEGNGYQVTWTYGHLCTLKEPNDYSDMWKHWSLGALPMIPQRFGIKLIEQEHIVKQFAIVEQLFKNADSIINCGDAGQEGELIQRWVMQKAGVHCPVKRLWISSLTEDSIKEGFNTLKDQQEYDPLYMAGLSRAIGDWLLGMNATRLYTIKYRDNRQRGKDGGNVLSIGRVQTPTLAMIVNRQKEIKEFKPEPYWVLSTIYRNTLFTATKGKYMKKEEGEAAFEEIKDKEFEVTGVTKKNGKEAPPQLFDLTTLQVECNKKYGYTAEMTLNIIQSLYEKKVTTYPRVDTQYLTDDIYKKCPQTLNGVFKVQFSGERPYADLVRAIGGKTLKKSKKVFDNSKVTDHHAIIPTGIVPAGLTDIERNVYDLVTRRFIAVFYPDCQFSTTTVEGKAGDVKFKVTGKEILEPGYLTVFEKAKNTALQGSEEGEKKDADEEKTLPTFVKGETGSHQPTLTEKQTTPPAYYTEATLLRAMETAGKFVDNEELRAAMKKNGIGRPSSRANIIETLFRRHYIKRERKRIVATPTGIALVNIIQEELLKSPELTGIWEKKLRDIEHKKYDAGTFINELKQQITDIVNHVLADSSNRKIEIIEQ